MKLIYEIKLFILLPSSSCSIEYHAVFTDLLCKLQMFTKFHMTWETDRQLCFLTTGSTDSMVSCGCYLLTACLCPFTWVTSVPPTTPRLSIVVQKTAASQHATDRNSNFKYFVRYLQLVFADKILHESITWHDL